jgi:hypothetical protein
MSILITTRQPRRRRCDWRRRHHRCSARHANGCWVAGHETAQCLLRDKTMEKRVIVDPGQATRRTVEQRCVGVSNELFCPAASRDVVARCYETRSSKTKPSLVEATAPAMQRRGGASHSEAWTRSLAAHDQLRRWFVTSFAGRRPHRLGQSCFLVL